MGLAEYERKRHFDRTPEPRGASAEPAPEGERSFVIQLHHASVRHYDFRLEVDGVLRSWSIPKGPSLRPGDRRLAVEVEDHPLEYADFSGSIPQGEYGAGHVAIFDAGCWVPSGDPAEAIARGKLEFELFGNRLRGRWNLIRTRRDASKPQWLLIKRTDEHAADLEADDLLDDLPEPPDASPGASAERGRRIRAARGSTAPAPAEAKGAPRGRAGKKPARAPQPDSDDPTGMTPSARTRTAIPSKRRLRAAGARPADVLDALRARARALSAGKRAGGVEFAEPMLTIAADEAPPGDDWVHEWKWDGYRVVAHAGAEPQLWSRNGLSWTGRVPEIVQALAALGIDAELDGELIAVDARGYSTFNGLQQALKDGETSQLRYCVFDLMSLDGYDLRDTPLVERKALLQQLLDEVDPRLFFSTHVRGQGPELFDAARAQGMEGIISKRAGSPYVSGRSTHWLKVKAVETRDFIVVGWSDPKGSRQGLGALLLAQRTGGELVYAGRVGSGLGAQMLRDLPRRLRRLATDTPPVTLPAHLPRPAGKVKWVRPELVVEVIFRGWSKEGLLRQATFHRLREDKPADEDTAGDRPGDAIAATDTSAATTPARSNARKAKGARRASRMDAADTSARTDALPKLSSPSRVVYPEAGHTKQAVWDYYLAVADRLLPELSGRLLSIVRCPQGIGGQRFFQKHAGRGLGGAVRRHTIVESSGEKAEYFYIDDVAGLMQLVQMNTIEFHPWGSTVAELERPDRIVFDLDPDPGVTWARVKQAAVDVRDRLGEVGLDSYPKLTGGKGVHVVVPLAPQADWQQVRRFCEAFADAMVRQAPERFVATMSKAQREGRIFIDWLRNGRGATAIASWSLRARAGAPAAVPLTWEELARVRKAARFTLDDAKTRSVPTLVEELAARRQALPLH